MQCGCGSFYPFFRVDADLLMRHSVDEVLKKHLQLRMTILSTVKILAIT